MSRGIDSRAAAALRRAHTISPIDRLPARQNWPAWARYGVAVLTIGMAVAIQVLLAGVFDRVPRWGLYYLAIFASTVLGGRGPGVLATALAILARNFLILVPADALRTYATGDLFAELLFIAIGAVIAWSADATEAMRAQARAALNEMEVVTGRMAAAITHCSADRRYLWASQYYADWLGVPLDQVIGRSIPEVIGEAACARLEPYFQRVLRGERIVYEDEVEFLGIGKRWIHATYVPTEDGRGSFDGWIAVITDITDRKRLELELEAAHRQAEARLRESNALMLANRELSHSLEVEALLSILCRIVRELVGADGATFIMRDGENVHYVAENAIEGLWKGRRFLATECISGWAILQGQTAAIPDIYVDQRIPLEAYRGTFVRSLVMVPVRRNNPLGAMGAYWKQLRQPAPEEIRLLEALADIASVAVQNATLFQEVQQANRAKDEFLAMLSHELRNPLAPIRNAVGILRLVGAPDPTWQQARDIIDRQVAHLTRLVDDLLEVSRVTRGKIALQRMPVSLTPVIEQAIETAAPLIEQHGHTLAVRLAPRPLFVEADRARLLQVIGNLLANAAKFTPRGGHIAIETELGADGAAIIRVRDTGIGIPKSSQARIFELFAQEETSLARSQGGLGIGLTLVKRLVELHGGQVAVESEGRNRGSTFSVVLPSCNPDLPTAALTFSTRTEVLRLRLLLIEDNEDAAESFKMLLELEGHDVRVAHHGIEALRLIDDFVPDVAFIDIGLPDISGFDLARRFRADPRVRHITLVALTGYGTEEDKQETRKAGFDHHLTKPVEIETVMSLLQTLPAGKVSAIEARMLN